MSIFRNSSTGTPNRQKGNRRVVSEPSANRKTEKTSSRVSANRKTEGGRNRRRPAKEKSAPTKNRKVNVDTAGSEETPLSGKSPEAIKQPPKEPLLPRFLPFLFSFLRLLAVLVCVGVVIWGGRLMYQYATSAKYFEIEHVEINGNERLNNADIMAAVGFEMGDNVFSIDLLKVEHQLEQQPWIVEARVTQKLPKTVLIEVVERKPELMVLFDVPYLVDEAGDVFKRWSPGDPLPRCVLTGISKKELIEDLEGAQKIVLDAISLRDRYVATGNSRYAKLYEIHREIDGGFSLAVGEKPFYVKLGKAPYRRKLNRLGKLFRKIGKDGKKPLIVYFDNEKRPDRVTVKLRPSKDKSN